MEIPKVSTNINLFLLAFGVILAIVERTCVSGQRSNRYVDGSLRLVGGRTRHEGTVLIYHWSRWGAICDDYWDVRDATVVCKELGYVGAVEAPTRSRFGKGRRRVWLSGLHCRGHERQLTMCFSRGWGNAARRCRSYYSSAGVVCNPQKLTTTTTTTTTTTLPPTNTTREKTTPKPTTTTIETTTKPPTTTTKATTKKPTTTLPPTTTPIPTTKRATTTKRPTTEIPTTRRPTTSKPMTTKPTTTSKPATTTPPTVYNRWIYNRDLWRYFMYFRDGTHVTSRPDPRYYQMARNTTSSSSSTTTSTTTTTTTSTTTPRPPRVLNPSRLPNTITGDVAPSQLDNTITGDVAASQLDNTITGDVAASQLDNTISNEIQTGSHHSRENSITRHEHRHPNNFDTKTGYVGDQPIVEDEPSKEEKDEKKEKSVVDEIVEKTTTKPPPTTGPNYDEYRIKGGREYGGYLEGRIEVRLAGSKTWGVICGDNWDFRAAIVACRHFGTGYARTAQKTDYYGGSNMDKLVSTMRCTGREERLEDCTMETSERTPGKEACSRAQSVAGIICDSSLPDLEPELKDLERSPFMQTQYLYYLQCAYEENCLSSSANDLYGTRSWAYASRRLLRFSTIAKNIGTADFRPVIDRSQWEWHACHMHYHSMEEFSHYDIIDEHGNRMAEGHKASFCLEDSSCDRGVHPKFNCQQFGNQGISVGCRDSYLSDIDCQWIDVTDVKPGLYTLKIELNPNMNVAESNYDNNVAKCQLYFTTQQVRIWDCKLDSLL